MDQLFPAVVATFLLYFVFNERQYVHPKRIGDSIWSAAAVVALLASFVVLFPSSKSEAIGVSVGLLFLAALAPVLGICERKRKPGQEIYAGEEGEKGMPWKRFCLHFASNIGGAVIVSLFLWSTVDSFPGYDSAASPKLLGELILLVAAYAILTFVRQDQLRHCPDMDLRYTTFAPDQIDNDLRGYSLTEWHQITNTVYLTLALFIGSASILFSLFGAYIAWFEGRPLEVPWLLVGLAGLFLLFLFSTALDPSEPVYATFIWGTPLILIFYILWFLLFDKGSWGNWWIYLLAVFVIVLVAYAAIAFFLWRRYRERTGTWKGFWTGLWPYSYRFLIIAVAVGVLTGSLALQLYWE